MIWFHWDKFETFKYHQAGPGEVLALWELKGSLEMVVYFGVCLAGRLRNRVLWAEPYEMWSFEFISSVFVRRNLMATFGFMEGVNF